MPPRSRYVTEYRAKFKPIDFEEAYRPPVLKPRAPVESPVLREIALRDRNEDKEHSELKPPAAYRTHTVSKKNAPGICRPLEPRAPIQSPLLKEIAWRDRNEDKEHGEPGQPDAHRTYSVSKNNGDSRVSGESDGSSVLQDRNVNLEEKLKAKKQKNNRGLQYKAGLALVIPRPNKENFLSEYRRQFGWKKPVVKESPILSADKVIFRSQANVSPDADARQKTKFSFKTEYQSQFVKHPWSPVQKRSNKKPPPSPDRLNKSDASDDSGVYDSEPSPKKPPSHPKVPQRPFVGQSEYRTNFQPPSNFQYTKGAWVGAGPPHLHMHQDHEAKEDEDAQPLQPKPQISWFQQVLELRDKARNYKLLARDGSQALQVFRRDQEERETNALNRDTHQSESPINDRDISPRASRQQQAQNKQRCDEQDENSAVVAAKSKESDNKDNSEDLVHQRTCSSLSDSQHSIRGDQRSSPDCNSSISSINLNEELNLSPDGRQATPELIGQRDTRRHHLDVTTPARGGPLLVSPPLDRVRRGPFNVYNSECASTCSSDERHSVLSETAMERRRALATETLKRARQQRAEMARRTGK